MTVNFFLKFMSISRIPIWELYDSITYHTFLFVLFTKKCIFLGFNALNHHKLLIGVIKIFYFMP